MQMTGASTQGFWFDMLGLEPKMYISNRIPDDIDAAGSGTIFW